MCIISKTRVSGKNLNTDFLWFDLDHGNKGKLKKIKYDLNRLSNINISPNPPNSTFQTYFQELFTIYENYISQIHNAK